MKATGIIRRVDDLGRVVIPKELRRTYGIHEGDPLELFTEDGDLIVIRKYDITHAVSDVVARLKQCIEDNLDLQNRGAFLLKVAELEDMIKQEEERFRA
ncbi:MAG: hypothetical protein ABT01_08590 [Clostridium sp. SCN 57-10]|nr:MAG: hypothetical protein ABT01_08590 [Clostridium sp. SCN 57-10]